ncbi:MAG: spore coat protein, partial [Chloroflexi bacterium]|nr:spore coat protein [Chloroflexota bacterium]
MATIRPSTTVNKLGDVCMANDCLDTCKGLALRYVHAASEAGSPNLRRTFQDLSREKLEMAEELFHWLHKQGWYPMVHPTQQQMGQIQ